MICNIRKDAVILQNYFTHCSRWKREKRYGVFEKFKSELFVWDLYDIEMKKNHE